MRRILLALCLFVCVSPALAASPEEKAGARTAAEAGIKAFKEEDYERAVSLLTQAEELVHAPPHLLYIARALEKQGQLVRARETLMLLINERLAPGVPEAFQDSQDIGKELLEEIEPRIARLTVRVEGADESVHIWIDGKEIPAPAIGLPYPVDPGERVLVAEAGTLRSGEVLVTLAEGESQDVILRLEFKSQAAKPIEPEEEKEPEPKPEPKPEPTPQKNRGLSPFVYAGFGTAAAGIIVGTTTGIMSLSKTSSTKDEFCVDDACSPEAEGDLDSAKTLATISNISFGVALVGVGVGVYGLLTGKSSTGSLSDQAGLLPELQTSLAPGSGSMRARWRF